MITEIEQIGGWWLPKEEQHLRQYLREHGDYQQRNRQKALRGLSPGGLAIDVGAHVGLWLRDLCDHFTEVIAVEPRSLHRQCLEQNVTHKNYHQWPVMLGAQRGRAGLEIDPENSGHTHRGPGEDYPVETIDDLIEREPLRRQLRFIKIDVEGDELRVIEGAEQTIKTLRPRLCIEQKPHPLSQERGRYAARDCLMSWGYAPLEHHGDDWVLEWRGL